MTQITFGLAGHTVAPAQTPYGELALDGEIRLLKSLNMKLYRGIAANSEIIQLGEYAMDRMITFTDKLRAGGIEPILTLSPHPYSYSSEAEAYKAGHEYGTYMGRGLSGKLIAYWEIGNEYDMGCRISGKSGHATTDFDTALFNIAKGMTRGLIEGLRSVNQSGKLLVGGSGWAWAFPKRLFQEGIPADYTKFHWYSGNDGASTAIPATNIGGKHFNLLQILADEGKPLF